MFRNGQRFNYSGAIIQAPVGSGSGLLWGSVWGQHALWAPASGGCCLKLSLLCQNGIITQKQVGGRSAFDSAELFVSLRISIPSQIILSKMLSWTILRRHALHKVVTFMVSNKLLSVSLTEEIRSVLNNLYTKSQCDFNIAKHLGLMKYCTVKERSKRNTFWWWAFYQISHRTIRRPEQKRLIFHKQVREPSCGRFSSFLIST